MSFMDSFVSFSNQLSNLVEKTVFVKSVTADNFVENLANLSGLRTDYVHRFFYAYPLVMIQTLLRNPKAKKLYNIVFGVIILQFCFGAGWIHSLISSTIVYLIIRFCNPKKQPIYVFVFSLLYLSLSALYTMLTDYMSYTLDSTTYQMMLVSRFQMLAWAYYDGTYDRENVDKGALGTDRWSRIYKRRQAEYITQLPTLLDYFGYVYHYPGILGGPNTYYREYYDVMTNIRYANGYLPSARWYYVLLNFIKGVCCFGVYVVASIIFNPENIFEPSFKQHSLFVRSLILYLTYLGVRFRYFGLWKLGESICICDGFGEQKDKEGQTNWDGISNIDILAFETTSNMSSATRLWNKRTQKWLQMCIYERSNFNQLYVFVVCAFWHGFYPSYYLCFLLGSVLQALNKQTSLRLWPRVKGTRFEKLYLRLGNTCVMTIGSFMLEAMFFYSFEKAWRAWSQMSFSGLWFCAIAFVILMCIPIVKQEKKEKKE